MSGRRWVCRRSKSRAKGSHRERRLILIVANRFDQAARKLEEEWRAHDAHVVTCHDLSVSGWRHYVGERQGVARAMIGGRPIATREITGVLTRTTFIWDQELAHIVQDDKGYIAAEMSAFLMSWLSALECPVLNRPVPGSLAGPSWHPEQWAVAAFQAGMRVWPAHRRVRMGSDPLLDIAPLGRTTATVVGRRCLGDAHPSLRAKARRLADIAEVDFLCVHFSGGDEDAYFAGANLFPSIASADARDAVLEYFSEPGPWSLPRPFRPLYVRQTGVSPAITEA